MNETKVSEKGAEGQAGIIEINETKIQGQQDEMVQSTVEEPLPTGSLRVGGLEGEVPTEALHQEARRRRPNAAGERPGRVPDGTCRIPTRPRHLLRRIFEGRGLFTPLFRDISH